MTLALIAFGVAMDCTAVSAACALRRISRTDLFKLAATCGSFQGGMALAGAIGGVAASRFVGRWDAWIALLLLSGVGGHMIWEALTGHDNENEAAVGRLTLAMLLVLGVATSVDSLVVGVTLPALGLPILLSAGTIALVSFAMSFVGAWVGVKAGERFGPSVEILGGALLILIGIHTILNHN